MYTDREAQEARERSRRSGVRLPFLDKNETRPHEGALSNLERDVQEAQVSRRPGMAGSDGDGNDSRHPWRSPSLRSGRFAVQIGNPADLSNPLRGFASLI